MNFSCSSFDQRPVSFFTSTYSLSFYCMFKLYFFEVNLLINLLKYNINILLSKHSIITRSSHGSSSSNRRCTQLDLPAEINLLALLLPQGWEWCAFLNILNHFLSLFLGFLLLHPSYLLGLVLPFRSLLSNLPLVVIFLQFFLRNNLDLLKVQTNQLAGKNCGCYWPFPQGNYIFLASFHSRSRSIGWNSQRYPGTSPSKGLFHKCRQLTLKPNENTSRFPQHFHKLSRSYYFSSLNKKV